MIYVLFWPINFSHFSGKTIKFVTNWDFLGENWTFLFPLASFDARFTQWRGAETNCCQTNQVLSWMVDASKVSSQALNFCRITKDVCGLALSSWKKAPIDQFWPFFSWIAVVAAYRKSNLIRFEQLMNNSFPSKQSASPSLASIRALPPLWFSGLPWSFYTLFYVIHL